MNECMLIDGLGYFSVIWKFELSRLYSVYCLRLQVSIVILCSHNFDKLASTCHILFPSFGTQNEILWAQTFWAESRSWIWDFKWNLNWTFKFEPRVQFCRLLSSMVFVLILFFSRVNSIVVDFEPLLYLYSDDQACNHSLYCAVGDPFSRKEIQVLFSFLSVLWFLWLFVVIYLNILTVSLYTLIS
jgi:hypothetical protein